MKRNAHEWRPFEALALAYVALPSVIFLAGWITRPLGMIAAAAVVAALGCLVVACRGREGARLDSWLPVIGIAGLWCVLAGVGHHVYANSDWVVRDAVLLDLVREPWPVRYLVDGQALLLRAPIGYFLPAALVGKVWGVGMAEQALLFWTMSGVALTFALMLHDGPPLRSALIRIAIFIAFSGMDILGTIAHYDPYPIGQHLEWWAYLFQYSSQTTQLFWVPNHALPGWLFIAWLVGQDPKRLSPTIAIWFMLFAPLWSPLTAIGIAPIVGIALVERAVAEPRAALRGALDWKMLVPLLVCVALVYPYLVAGSDQVASGSNSAVRWVGEDFVPRWIEFVLFEFAGIAVLLLWRQPGSPQLWTATVTLLLLPIYRFGPFNDLAMRASIPALTLYAIEIGAWLSTPHPFMRNRRSASIAVVLLAIGAVTPFMEIARVFLEPAWPMNREASVVEVTRGAHYLTSPDQPWLRRFIVPPH